MIGILGIGAFLALRRSAGAGSPQFVDPATAKKRLEWGGFEAELQVHAIVPENGSGLQRASDLASHIASSYGEYTYPGGARVVESWKSAGTQTDAELVSLDERVWKPLAKIFTGLARKVPPISSLEVGALWHPLHPRSDPDRVMRRMRYRPIADNTSMTEDGVLFGVTTGGTPRPARFSRSMMWVHHVYIGGTRMGKSTLMILVAAQRMRAKDQGLDDATLVVVDPHSDLVRELIEQAPRALRDRIWLIDLSSRDRVPAINLLDTRLFPDRDLTCDGLARVMYGIWSEVRGPRMQTVIAYTTKALYEANLKRRREDQYTIRDAQHMLSNSAFRTEALRQVEDPEIVSWWLEVFDKMPAVERSQYIGPVVNRLAQFVSAERVGQIFGQPASTVPLSKAIANGDIILVDTAPASVGREVASLMGAAFLNLMDASIRRSGRAPAADRRRMMVVVDEAQTIPGIAYDDMLGEAAKFGGTFVIAAQNLQRLDEMAPEGSMRTNLMANAGCLAVFNSEFRDAQYLVNQMGSDFVTADDVRGLPSHNAYVQTRTGDENPPPSSVRLLWPEPGDPDMADLIRSDTRFYTLPVEVAKERARAHVTERISAALNKLRGPRLAEE